MKNNFLVLLVILLSQSGFSQELNCKVVVDYSKISTSNPQVYKTLEKTLTDFVNKTNWTEKNYKPNEKINCSLFISVTNLLDNQFEASIQVQSSRPIYNSIYASPVLNINDKDFNFQYTEFENLVYNPNSFDSNLTAVIAFYCHVIIGVDAETFLLDSGSTNFDTALNICNLGATSSNKGWGQNEKSQNRYFLINDLVSASFKPYREAMNFYHLKGLDLMQSDLKSAKEGVKSAVAIMKNVYTVRPNAFLLRIFTDAKSDEIISIFSGGPSVIIDDLVSNLNRISPTNGSKWAQIKL